MTKFIVGLILILSFSTLTYAQKQQIAKSTLPSSATYEMIHDPNNIENTYMLNRHTGESWFLVKSNKEFYWQKIPQLGYFRPKDSAPPKIWKGLIYQIIISDYTQVLGNHLFNTYLVNTATGATWALINDPAFRMQTWSNIFRPLRPQGKK